MLHRNGSEAYPKRAAEEFSLEILLDNEVRPDFKPKIENFISHIHGEVAFLQDYHAEINTYNSFPHSSGIASSASGMSALALCLLSLKEMLTGQDEENFFRTASQWARLGSGSASRSVYGGLVEWGRFSQLPESSDQFAIPYRGEGTL
ncbi:MAG: hypothetical protein U5L96_20370 [Owenweeksia sp.]|nr:hypothetical protein [Owenweeksia sp.]